jgi:hypothetical protein
MRKMLEGAAGAMLIAWMVTLGGAGAPPATTGVGPGSILP